MEIHVLASGSSGNCICIDDNDHLVIVDAGVSYKCLQQSLPQKDYKSISMFITHEHTDHIKGIKPIFNKLKPKVYASGGTVEILSDKGIDDESLYILQPDTSYDMGVFGVRAFGIEHDAVEPFGYRFEIGGKDVGIATDLGIATDYVLKSLEGSDTLILESNYEDDLLKACDYPEQTKKRIASRKGHLSNKDAMALAGALGARGLKRCFLGHVSENCNDYELLEKYAKYYNECYNIETSVLHKTKYKCYSL